MPRDYIQPFVVFGQFNDGSSFQITTEITVVDRVAEMVGVAPVSSMAQRLVPFNFSARGVFQNGSTAEFTNLCTWSSSDPLLFLALDETFAKDTVVGFAAGTGEIEVHCSDIETSTSITFY